MFRKKNRQLKDDRLDRFGRVVMRAAVMSDDEAEMVALSPFLYTRLRARIAAEQEQRAGASESWLAMLLISRRAVPTMALVAAIAALMLWFAGISASTTRPFSEEAFFDARETGVEHIVLTETGALSRDEVLAIVVNQDEQGMRK